MVTCRIQYVKGNPTPKYEPSEILKALKDRKELRTLYRDTSLIKRRNPLEP